MSSTNDILYDRVMKSISDLFSDVSVDCSTTKINLETLIEELQTMINSLDECDE